MSEVKWIKITTDMFDDEKMVLIESLPDAYAIIVVWFKLLCLAGKQNNGGVFMLNDRIAYTDKMLATIFRMNEATVTMAIRVFEDFGMIETIDNVITIPNWNKHQSLDAYEKKKERDRLYKQKRREEQKLLTQKSSDKSSDSTSDVAVSEKEIDKEIDIYNNNIFITEKSETNKTNYQQIVDKYNSICKSLPKVKKLSDARKKSIKARLNKYSFDEIITVFEKAEASRHLTGDNNYNWRADFDWLMSDKNMAKVFDGKYDNEKMFKNNNPKNATVTSSNTVTDRNTNTDRNTYTPKTTNRFNNFEQRQYSDDELDALERKLLSR